MNFLLSQLILNFLKLSFIPDEFDAFPYDSSEYLDTDMDGIGNNADSDDDGDGVNDGQDEFPLNPWESSDFDGDGVGDNADTDDDNDGVADNYDAFPFNPSLLDYQSESTNSNLTDFLLIVVILILLVSLGLILMKRN